MNTALYNNNIYMQSVPEVAAQWVLHLSIKWALFFNSVYYFFLKARLQAKQFGIYSIDPISGC